MGLYWECDVIDDLGYPEDVDGVPVDYDEGNAMFCDTFLSVVNELCPVDTGYLVGSVGADYDEFSIVCDTHCEYAQYVEYGTWCMGAQPYFEPALLEAYYAAQPFWALAVEEAQEEAEAIRNAAQAAYSALGGGAGGFMGGLLLGGLVGLGMGFLHDVSGGYDTHLTAGARDFAENVGNYAMISAWESGASWLGGTAVGMLAGAATFIFLAPLAEAVASINEDHERRQASQSHRAGTGVGGGRLPPVEIT